MTPLFNSSDRLEALSDGVFAIVITLLVLGLRVPPAKSAGSPALLWQALLGHWPSYFAFLLSFGTILIAWIGHHLVLQEVKTVSRALVWTNGFYLAMYRSAALHYGVSGRASALPQRQGRRHDLRRA